MNRPIIKVKLEQIKKAPWNYKTDGTKELIAKLCQSATYQKSIGIPAVRELGKGKYEIIDGNHRRDALEILKRNELFVENFGKIKKSEAVVISKQRNADWFAEDPIKFAELFRDELAKDFKIEELEKMLPMTKEELEGITALLDFDWEQYASDGEEKETSGLIKLQFKVEESVNETWEQWVKASKQHKPDATLEQSFELAIVTALEKYRETKTDSKQPKKKTARRS